MRQGWDAKVQRGNILLGTVTWRIKSLVETARRARVRKIYKYPRLRTSLRFKIKTRDCKILFRFRIRVSPLQWNMAKPKRISLRIFALLLLISTSSFHLLRASDDADDDAVIHLLLFFRFNFVCCVRWMIRSPLWCYRNWRIVVCGFGLDLLWFVRRGFWRPLGCVSERWVQW